MNMNMHNRVVDRIDREAVKYFINLRAAFRSQLR